MKAENKRGKRGTLSPAVFSPSILQPSVFGQATLSPSLFTRFVVIGRETSLLSHTKTMAFYEFLWLQFRFNPSVLSPTALGPGTLSPGIGNPAILSPSVLSPATLSPSLMTPLILSPSALSPSVSFWLHSREEENRASADIVARWPQTVDFVAFCALAFGIVAFVSWKCLESNANISLQLPESKHSLTERIVTRVAVTRRPESECVKSFGIIAKKKVISVVAQRVFLYSYALLLKNTRIKALMWMLERLITIQCSARCVCTGTNRNEWSVIKSK